MKRDFRKYRGCGAAAPAWLREMADDLAAVLEPVA